MEDLDEIIRELEKNYPKWLVKGLSQSDQIKNMEAALVKLAGLSASSNKGFKDTIKTTKDVRDTFSDLGKGLNDFDKIIGKTADSFDDILKSTDDLAKAHENLRKKLLGNIGGTVKASAKDLMKYGLGTAAETFSTGLLAAGKSMTGFTGVAVAALGMLSKGVSSTARLIYDNNAAYIRLSKEGLTLSNSLSGVTQGAIAANMSLSDFTQLALDNAGVLAQMGSDGVKDLGRFTRNVRLGTNIMGRFGFDVEEVNDYLTAYLDQQKVLGFLNLRSQRDMNAGFQQFLVDAAQFSNILGYARRDVIKSVTQVTSSPQWGFFIKSLGDAGVNVNNAFTKASETIGSIAGPELGGKFTELLRDYVTVGGPANEQTRETATILANLDSKLLQQIQTTARSIRQGNIGVSSTKELYEKFYEASSAIDNENAFRLSAAHMYEDQLPLYNALSGSLKNNNDYLAQNNLTLAQQLDLKAKEREQNEDFRQAMANLNEASTALGNTWDAIKSALIVFVEPALTKLGQILNNWVLKPLLSFAQILADISTGKIFSVSYWKNKVFGGGSAETEAATYGSTAGLTSTASAALPAITRSMGVPTGAAPRVGAKAASSSQGVINYLMGKGWSKEQATGIAANLYAESKFDPAAIGDGGQAYGVAQWHPDRQSQFRAFKGRDIRGSSLEDQLDFVDYELRQGSDRGARAAGTALMGATSASQAASIVSRKYERPADVWGQANARAQIATTFASTTSTTPSAAPTAPAPTTTAASGGSDQVVALLSAQVKQLQDAVDKLSVIAVNTGDHTDKLRKLTNEVKNNGSSM